MLESRGNNNYHIEAPMLIDEISSTEIYLGFSKGSSDPSKPNWRIKRIWKIGSVWKMGFPKGNQDYINVWDDRFTYLYGI